jgi:hypothetical protein
MGGLTNSPAFGKALELHVTKSDGLSVNARKILFSKFSISDALPFGGLWYAGPNAIDNAIGYAKFRNRSHDAPVSN